MEIPLEDRIFEDPYPPYYRYNLDEYTRSIPSMKHARKAVLEHLGPIENPEDLD